MFQDFLPTCTLPVIGGFFLLLLIVDLFIGKKDPAARRSRIVLTVIVAVAEGGLIAWRIINTSYPDPFITLPRPPLVVDPPGEIVLATETNLKNADVPAFDPDLAIYSPDSSTAATPLAGHELGDHLQFAIRGHLVDAELIYVNEPVYAWLVSETEIDQNRLRVEIDRFVIDTMPAVRRYLDFQDDAAEIHILNYRGTSDGIYGFFLPETGVFHVNLAHSSPEQESYQGTLAHELQHAFQWQADPNEERWLDEGFSELVQLVAGFDPGRSDEVFRQAFDTQLNLWPYDGEGEPPTAHYGASYRFVLYLREQFGDGFIRELARHPANGLSSVDLALTAYHAGVTSDDVFADWVLVNAVDHGDYRYENEEWEPSLPTWVESAFYRYPMVIQSTVYPYATDYFRLENTHPSTIHFTGTTQARLLPADPHSGERCWWSNATHHSNTRLVREVDLTTLSKAALRFWTWYDTAGEDSRTVLSVSSDDGKTWTLLQEYSGQSGGWV
jgi:hypothetical protein